MVLGLRPPQWRTLEQLRDGPKRTSALSTRSNTLESLAGKGLVAHHHGDGWRLTKAGREALAAHSPE
jgi:hypothetical protein